jgi:hypothetical protein
VVTTGNETPLFGGEMNRIMSTRQVLVLILVALGSTVTAAVAQLQGGIQEKQILAPANQSGSSYSSYPAPQMIQPPQQQHAPPMHGNAFSNEPLQGSAQHHAPIQGGVTKVALPPGFMGAWAVRGQRTKVEAQSPDFQQQAENAFQMTTSNTWNISGNPQSGYKLTSDSGIDTQFWVDKLEGGAAFIRYQHPVKNTMAQEAVVMTLGNGGTTFEGLERISIVKQGVPQPRVKVQYQLAGQRQH